MRSIHRVPPRRGVALLLVVVALAMVGALIGGLLGAALRERRDGGDAIRRVRALAAAEYGLVAQIAAGAWAGEWSRTTARGVIGVNTLAIGDAVDSVRVYKLDQARFLLASTGVAGSGPWRARQRVGLLVELRAPAVEPRAALLIADSARLDAGASVSGADTAPDGWSCPPDGAPLPGIAIAPRAPADTSACTRCTAGSPAVLLDSGAADPSLRDHPAPVARATLLAGARELASGTVLTDPAPVLDAAGACDERAPGNLGDPLRALGPASPCAAFFPVLHASGDLHLQGGAAQGVLLVDGDLHLERGAAFFGIALVRGALVMSPGARVVGAARAGSVTLAAASLVHASRCAIARALIATASPRPIARYPWLTLW